MNANLEISGLQIARSLEQVGPDTLSPADYIEHILDRELTLTLHGVALGSERDDSMRQLTETAATLYDGFILRELIQNAYDGSGQHSTAEIHLKLDLSAGEFGILDVVNNGDGFSRADVDSIVNPARSRKRPGNSIGHKGLGFRSVTLISQDPQIYSVGTERTESSFNGFSFRFASEAIQRERLRKLAEPEIADKAVGRTHRLQLPVAITEAPDDVLAFARAGFATLVRLPLIDNIAAVNMEREWNQLFSERAPLALFLTRLTKLTLEKIDRNGEVMRREIVRRSYPLRDISPFSQMTLERVDIDDRSYLYASRAVERQRFLGAVERAIAERYSVEKWREWEGDPIVSIALPLTADSQEGRYYAFLPMEEASPFSGHLDAPFFPNPDRQSLDLGNPLNDELVNVSVEMCVALLSGFAAQNVSTPAYVHAAIDAIIWPDRDRLIAAVAAAGLKLESLPLPVMKQQTGTRRWGTLDRVFDWDDQSYKSFHATWLARVTGEQLLRRAMGARRVSALRELADYVGLSLVPDRKRLAGWIPQLVSDLSRHRKTTNRQWEDFYADLAEMRDVLPLLRGQLIFRSERQRLVRAEGGAAEEGRPTQLFINADAGRTSRKRRRLDGASLLPPPCITKGMEFADQALEWPSEVVAAFVEAELAKEFQLIHVISRLGVLQGERPRPRDVHAVLAWAFRMWKDHRSEEFEKALAEGSVWVPLAFGGVGRADRAYFSAGWRDTLGDLLSTLCEEAPQDLQIGVVAKNLLPNWQDWPVASERLHDWRDFLRHAGVKDGLPCNRTETIRMQQWQWAHLKSGGLPVQTFEKNLGGSWRAEVARVQGGFGYQSGVYVISGIPYLCGQAGYESLSGPARSVYGQLAIRTLEQLSRSDMMVELRREGTRYDVQRWPSGIVAFLRSTDWLPAAGEDDFLGLHPNQCWLGGRGEVPRFVRKIDRSVREVFESNEKLQQVLSKELGMLRWADVTSAPARIAALGAMLVQVPESLLDDFRKAYREAWQDYGELKQRPVLKGEVTLAVEIKGRLVPMTVSKQLPDGDVIYVDDTTHPVYQQVLSSLGYRTLEVTERAATVCVTTLQTDLGCNVKLIQEDILKIETDGRPFAPCEEDVLLVDKGREWIADVAVLVLEVSTTLTNQNTQRNRQALSDAIRRVRVRFAERVMVAVDGQARQLPAELGGVLPVPHSELPTIIAVGKELDWGTLTRLAGMLALAIGRPNLMDAFRFTFVALANEMSRESSELRAPSDEELARALGRPVSRIVELLRSLRATTPRLMTYLLPVLHAIGYENEAIALAESADRMNDDSEVVAALVKLGVGALDAVGLVEKCRHADTLNGVRRDFDIAFTSFNRSLGQLGYKPLAFREHLVERFALQLDRRRGGLERIVRDAHRSTVDGNGGLAGYLAAVSLAWITMPEDWVHEYDDVDPTLVNNEIDRQVAARFGSGPFASGEPPELLRQKNRQLLASLTEELRRLIRAWCRKRASSIPEAWIGTAEALGRAAVISGTFDFDRLDADSLVQSLRRANLWPIGMAPSRSALAHGLSAIDLQIEEQEERERQRRLQKERRSVRIGNADIDGGEEGWFEAVASAMSEALDSDAFHKRSGLANLQAFEGESRSKSGRSGGGARSDDPQYLSQEQRDLIGFAGELAAYHYLRRKHRHLRPDHWVSSMGRRYQGLAPLDDQGFDFKVSDTKGTIHYEVKAHTGDPGYVELERSQVMEAVSMRNEGGNRWRILYVAYVRTGAVTVLELPNPYASHSASLFRESHRHGVRLAIRWA